MVGCGDDEPLEIDCPAGYITIRVEADSDEFVCTKAPQAECDEGLIAVPTDDGKFMCMDAHECADDDVAVQQPDGRYQCIPIVDVNCSSGKVVMEASNGTIACVDPPSVDCEDGMVPLQSDAGIVTCVPQQNIECEAGMVAMEGSNGLIACVSQTNLECEDGMVPMAGENGFACVPPTSIDCADDQVPMLTSNGGVACVSQVNLDCDDGMVPTQTDNGIFACIEQIDIECTDGKVAVLQGDVFACVAPVDIECATGKVPVEAPNGTYACRDPLTVDCDPGLVATEMDDGTYACIAMSEIDCPDNFLPVQAGDSTFSCVEVVTEDIAPGTIACPSGTFLVEDETNQLSCRQINQFQCPDGYQLIEGGTGGWQCVNYRSGDEIEIVVDGTVIDSATDYPLGNVTVTLMGLQDVDGNTIVVTTDDSGYFRANGYASGETITAIYNLPGYIPNTETSAKFGNIPGTTITQPEDTNLGEIGLVAVPPSNLVVAGTVLADGALAAGVDVQLRSVNTSELTPEQAQTVTTDANGLFVFDAVPNGEYEVLISQFDADGDGQPDYKVQRWDCGAGVSLETCDQDIGNLQLTLQPYFSGDVVYTNLLNLDGSVYLEGTETADLAADVLGETFLMPAGGTNMVFQLSDPIDTTNAIIEFWSVDQGGDVAEVGATVTASTDGKTLTITPSAALVGDSDPNTLYDIRIRSLAWMNGEYVQAPTGGTASHIYVDVKAPADYAPNPTNLALYWGSNADATGGAIDADNAWYLNNGQAIENLDFDAVEMSWTVAAGAAGYRVYARWMNDFGSYDGQEWVNVNDKEFGAYGDNNLGTTAWGVISLDEIITETGWTTPVLGFGRGIQITLASVNTVGDITPVTPTNIITISDGVLLGLDPTVTQAVNAAGLDSPAVEVKYDLQFSEDIGSTFAPTLAPLASGAVTVRTADALEDWEWGDAGPWQDAGTAGITVLENRYDKCMMVDGDAMDGDSEFATDGDDTDLFVAGDALLGFAAGAPVMNDNAGITVQGTFNNNVFLTAALTARDDNDDDIPDGPALADGSWICSGTFPTVTGLAGDATDGDEMATVTISGAPTNFFIGQQVCFVPSNEDPVTCDTIRAINYASNQLLFDCVDADVDNDCDGPDNGARVVRPGVAGARNAEEVNLIQGATLSATTTTLRVAVGDLAALEVAAGDLLLIDVDGDWSTANDRVRAAVTQAVVTYRFESNVAPAVSRNEIVIGAPSPANTSPLTEDSLVILLGNTAMGVTNMASAADSSGNTATSAFYNEVATCDAPPIADVNGDDICSVATPSFVF